MIHLPNDFQQRIVDLHGDAGREWLTGLPECLRELGERWGVREWNAVPELTYNYVALARRNDGSEAVLKLGVPGVAFEREAAALRWFGGMGAAYLLEYDAALGGMLLERVRPGTDLTGADEVEGVEAAAYVMERIHRPAAEGMDFPTVHDWGRGFGRFQERFEAGTGPLPLNLVEEARRIFHGLADSMSTSVLLHGDLHHGNILAAERMRRLAIDPQGVLGEPAYEVGAFLRNPFGHLQKVPDLRGLLERRVRLFSEITGWDAARIAGWGFSQAVLSAIWSVEDHGAGWEGALAVAQALRDTGSCRRF